MEGYAKIADLMSRHDELAVFRRFGAFNMQNLLYLQAEIMHIEVELNELAENDKKHEERSYHSRDWWSLSQSDDDGCREQWEKILQLREKIERYSAKTS